MYDVLLIDPPWSYGSKGARSGEFAELDYPTMTVADLKALPIQPWTNPNCAMFMWVTGSFITEALELGAAWGFKFIRLDKVWVKKTGKGGRHGVVGPWGMTDAEYILLFVRGQMCSKQVQRNQFVIEVATYPGVHSRKPAIFRQMIEDRFPADFKRLELFSREQVPGWTVIGNDIDGRDIRDVLASLPANDNDPKAEPTPANDNRPLTYGSVCSGIEAASVAWEPLGWEAAWFSEIEPFPSAVLAHHWPAVSNLGDMTKIAAMVANDNAAAPDVLVGGTPCQAFSVAGMREGLSDDRGQLTLEFVRLADAIDSKRTAAGFEPAIIVWENVPGVLSSKDNAFGCFLAGLAGESEPLEPSGAKWSNAGYVSGPKRTIAWRILDAQYFGVAQRRRRVFVVASARKDFNPAAVLFESEGVRRDIAPSRDTREEAATVAGTGVKVRSHWDSVSNPHPTLSQSHNTGGIGQSNQEIFSQRGAGLVGTGFDENGLQHIVGTLCADTHPGAYSGQDAYTGRLVPQAAPLDQDICGTLTAGFGKLGAPEVDACTATPAYSIHGTQDPIVANDMAHCLGRNSGQENALAYGFQQRIGRNGRGDMGELVSALTAQAGETGKGDSAPCVAVSCVTGDITHTLKAEGFDGSEDGTGRGQPLVNTEMQVRRLTPTECERLQGFPDGYSLVPVGKKMAADGPRYKALGNSMAVPCMNWIGSRIHKAVKSCA